MNVVLLAGTLQREADYKMTATGMGVSKFTIKVQATSKDKATGKYLPEYYNCVAFGKTAENIANYVHDKDSFCIRGHLAINKWTDKDGGNHKDTNIVVDAFDFPAKPSQASSFDAISDGEIDF